MVFDNPDDYMVNNYFELKFNDSPWYYFHTDKRYLFEICDTIYVQRSTLFNDLHSLILIDKYGDTTEVLPYFTLRSLFPLVPMLLCIPMLTFWLKRPSTLFSLFHKISLYFIPIVFCFALFSNWRIIQLFVKFYV